MLPPILDVLTFVRMRATELPTLALSRARSLGCVRAAVSLEPILNDMSKGVFAAAFCSVRNRASIESEGDLNGDAIKRGRVMGWTLSPEGPESNASGYSHDGARPAKPLERASVRCGSAFRVPVPRTRGVSFELGTIIAPIPRASASSRPSGPGARIAAAFEGHAYRCGNSHEFEVLAYCCAVGRRPRAGSTPQVTKRGSNRDLDRHIRNAVPLDVEVLNAVL